MQSTVRVRLRKPRRVFSFLCGELDLKRDEPCIVQSDRGLEYGVCILPPEPLPQEMAKRYSMRVVRRVSQEDEQTHAHLLAEERKAQKICDAKIRSRKLPMKLVETEYTFDKKKIIFYFTAEDRVDFRELVRDLAHELRSRIEMRHIQVRDEAKMVGGIGTCGRELCCTTWLNEFKPISMRMAKRQNLSLNPSKISGQCGRLLCCLSYENELYEEARRAAKKAAAEQRAAELRASEGRAAIAAEGEASGDAPATAEPGAAPPQQQQPPRPSAPRAPRGEGPRDRDAGARDAGPRGRGPRPPRAESRPPRPESSALRPSEAAPPAGEASGDASPAEGAKPRKRRRRRRKGGGQGGAPGEGGAPPAN